MRVPPTLFHFCKNKPPLDVKNVSMMGRGLIATSDIKAGSVIFEEEPFVTDFMEHHKEFEESLELENVEEDFQGTIRFLANLLVLDFLLFFLFRSKFVRRKLKILGIKKKNRQMAMLFIQNRKKFWE